MLLKFKRFTLISLFLFFSSSQAAHAIIIDSFIIESFEPILIIDTSIGSYEISTIFGSYESQSAILENQPWWDNLALAEEFTTVIGDLLGFPNSVPQDPLPPILVGPAFAAGIVPIILGDGEVDTLSGCALINTDISCFPSGIGLTAELDFAIASRITTQSISEPATGLLFGMSLIALILSSRKRKASEQI